MIECDGRCVTGDDLGMPEYASAGYFDPECSVHGDGDQWRRGKADGELIVNGRAMSPYAGVAQIVGAWKGGR